MVTRTIVEQPDLGEVIEPGVLVDLLRIEVAVVVDDGLPLGVPMVEPAGPFG